MAKFILAINKNYLVKKKLIKKLIKLIKIIIIMFFNKKIIKPWKISGKEHNIRNWQQSWKIKSNLIKIFNNSMKFH